MKQKSMIVWILLLGIVVLLLSTLVQAKELTEVYATDILKQIENGEDISLENVRIIGVFNLTKIELKTVPVARAEWEIKYADLEGELKIVERLKIERLKIVESEIAIINSIFEDDVDTSRIQFRKKVDFSATTFLGESDFKGADFRGNADFGYADFSGDAYFQYVDFRGVTSFLSADFRGNADFWYANFSGDADFIGADFSGDAYFTDADFTGYATFDSTELNKVSFTGATFTSVSLDESEFNQMRVEWSALKDALSADGLTYLRLIKNFRGIEQFEDADAAYYQYRRLSQANKKWSFSKLGDVFIWVTCGYGVKPHYTIGLALVLILLFALIYWRGGGIMRLKEGDDSRVSFWDAFYFSVVTFTTVGYGDWYPVKWCRTVVMVEGLFGWLTLALFLVTLANVMIRP